MTQGIAAELAGLRQDIQHLIRQQAATEVTVASLSEAHRTERASAARHRNVIYDEIKKLGRAHDKTDNKLEAVVNDVAEMKPVVERTEQREQQLVGAAKVGRVVYAFGSVVAMLIAWIVAEARGWINVIK